MGCKHNNQNGDCVCAIVRRIAEKQQDITNDCCDTSCEESIKSLTAPSGVVADTVPLMFICEGDCDFFVGSGVFRDTVGANTFFECIETPLFRVKEIVEGTECCAVLELLQPQTARGVQPGPTGKEGVCRFFPGRSIENIVRTGICITVDLNCFCGVECLSPVLAPKVRPIPTPPPVPPCTNPAITLNVPESINCAAVVDGIVTCDGNPVAGALVNFSSDPDIVNFFPNPAVTNALGEFSTSASVDPGTTSQSVDITATTTVNGVTDSATETTTVECPAGCPDNCSVHIGTEVSDAVVQTTTSQSSDTFTGFLNSNILRCLNCNEATNNFNINFNNRQGTTINFTQGRVSNLTCTPNVNGTGGSVTLQGTAQVSGNNPYQNNSVFNVEIQVTNAGPNATWTITATSGSQTFTTTFEGEVNPNVIEKCT